MPKYKVYFEKYCFISVEGEDRVDAEENAMTQLYINGDNCIFGESDWIMVDGTELETED